MIRRFSNALALTLLAAGSSTSAEASAGVVHRDVKPSNLPQRPKRGPYAFLAGVPRARRRSRKGFKSP